jgi:hypothetical protein
MIWSGFGLAAPLGATLDGLALDARWPQPCLLICDRRNRWLVHYDLEGSCMGVVAEKQCRPCTVAFCRQYVAVVELEGQVSVLDREAPIAAVLGDNPDQSQRANYDVEPPQWCGGVFNTPDSFCFDHEGYLLLQEWNRTGRLAKLLLAWSNLILC